MSIELGFTFAAGALMGTFYFGGLWLTVRLIRNFPNKAAIAFASFIVRLMVVFVALYVITAGRWERLLVALFGFYVVRTCLIERIHSIVK